MTEYTYTDEDGDTVTVRDFQVGPPHSRIAEVTCGATSVFVPKEQAPALALAVLEAAGYGRDEAYTGAAIGALRRLAEKQAEDKENEQLDKEAKALYDAFGKVSVFIQYPWEGLGDAKDPWIAAAKKARELHKGAK